LNSIYTAAGIACDQSGAESPCQEYFTQRIKILIAGFVKGSAPAAICKSLMLCNNVAQLDSSINKEEQEKTAVDEESNPETLGSKCSTCMTVIDRSKLLLTNKTSAGVQRAVRAACSRVQFASSVCSALLGQFMTAITADLLNKISSNSICSKIRMCSE